MKLINVNDYNSRAIKKLPKPVFDYLEGGAEDEAAVQSNRNAFKKYGLLQKVLTDVSGIDPSTKIMGMDSSMPLYISAVGQQRMFHKGADLEGVRAAKEKKIPFSLSTFSSKTIEEVGEEDHDKNMFQVYVLSDDKLNSENIQRARKAGFKSLMLTVDTVVAGNRERDVRNGMSIPLDLNFRSMLSFALHPKWVWDYFFTGGRDLVNLPNVPDRTSSESFWAYMSGLLRRKLTWDYAQRMIDEWQGPFAIKGIVRVDDAIKAVEIGASTIIVSNHGGRQLGAAADTLSQVRKIREAVGDQVEICLDGGIRRGSDVLKAIAMGANSCGIGRAYVYGLAANGQKGVEGVLDIFRAEILREMALLGVKSIAEIDESYLTSV